MWIIMYERLDSLRNPVGGIGKLRIFPKINVFYPFYANLSTYILCSYERYAREAIRLPKAWTTYHVIVFVDSVS